VSFGRPPAVGTFFNLFTALLFRDAIAPGLTLYDVLTRESGQSGTG